MTRHSAVRSLAALGAGAVLAIVSGRSSPQAAPLLRAERPASGSLLVSSSVYRGSAYTVTVGDPLPPVSSLPQVAAVADGTYPGVFNNDSVDASFGVTSPIHLDRYDLDGTRPERDDLRPDATLAVPWNLIVTSFSSKSELALSPSTDGKHVTFMGYIAPPNTLDVSNSNTPGHLDPTNPVGTSYRRAIGQVDAGRLDSGVSITPVNAYSGNNGRAAILDSTDNQYLMVGNAGNGSGAEPNNIISNTGVQLVAVGGGPETTVVGIPQTAGISGPQTVCQYGFSIVALGAGQKPDKCGKDDNFRGMAIFANTLYTTKGSGSNGVNTVYQVGSAGTLPTAATAATTPITILPGFPTTLAKTTDYFPFGIWFADAHTLYVADEGDGTATDPHTGLQKWVLESDNTWHNVYTLQNGLNLGVKYSVPKLDSSLDPATVGLRSLTGRVNGDGTVTLFSATSTASASGDQGADPNKLVEITDKVSNLTATGAGAESFTTLRTAGFAEVLRGVAWLTQSCDDRGGSFGHC